jgi:MFS family permease
LSEALLSAAERRKNLIAVTAAMTATSLIYGLSVPLLSLILESRGFGGTMIGSQTAVQSAAILLVSPALPRHMSRTGPAVLMLGAILVSIVAFMLLAVLTSVPAWFVLRFVIGAAGGVLWVCGEAWLNQVADDATRGRVVAAYSMAVSGGFALGPLILSFTGSQGLAPFLISGAVMLLSALPLLTVVGKAPRLSGERSGGLYHYFRLAPVAMLLCALFAATDGMLISFLPLYGTDVGLGEATSLYLITLIGIGGIAGQLPIGWLADRVDRMLLAGTCTLLVAGAAAAMPLAISEPPWNFLFMFMFGAVLSGIYTVALVIIGEQFRGADLAAASALFGVMWGAGSVIGPQLGGLAYDYLPPHGIPYAIAATAALLLPLPFAAWLRRPSQPDHSEKLDAG